jgi:hypothetical protein
MQRAYNAESDGAPSRCTCGESFRRGIPRAIAGQIVILDFLASPGLVAVTPRVGVVDRPAMPLSNGQMVIRIPFVALLVGAALVLLSSPAYAYIDPGTGSMVIQAVAAAILGSLAFIKIFWRRLRAVFRPRNGRQTPAEHDVPRP